MKKTAFRDIRTGGTFYDQSGNRFLKADSRWAIRVRDGARYEIEPRNLYQLRQPNDE
jgi:hypothetical protein